MFTDNVLENIYFLPQELKDIIFGYVDNKEKIFVTKEYYIKYHNLLIIPKYNSYLRFNIRHDNNFVINRLIQENLNSWIKFKNIKYKNTIYASYLQYILALCIDYSSMRCKKTIEEFYKSGLGKKRPKNNRIKNIKWTN